MANDPLNLADPTGATAAIEYGMQEDAVDAQIVPATSMVGEQTALQYARVVAKTVNQVLQRHFQMMVRNALSSSEWQALKAAQEPRNFLLINKFIGQAVHRATAEALRDAGSPGRSTPTRSW